MTGWLHAWRSWLQRRSSRGAALPVPERQLRPAFLEALETALQGGEARCQALADEVFCLIIPPFDPQVTPSQHHAGIDACLERLAASPDDVASLTWSSLLQAQPRFEPSYRQWAGAHASHLDGGIGVVFFVDMEAVGQRVTRALQRAGYRAERLADAPTVRVEQGDYQLDIGLEALVVEALWTMRDVHEVVADRARVVPLELAAYHAMAQALRERFPELHLTVDGASWLLERGGRTAQVSYRGLVRTCRQAGLDAVAFLARCTLDDVVDARPVHAKIKSPAFASAYPDAHLQHRGGFVEVLARDDESGTRYVLRGADDPPDRAQHLQLLRQLSLSRHCFEGHLFRVEVGSAQAICVAGDQAASLTAEPALVAGLLAAAGWTPSQVRLRARDERGLVIAQPEVVDEALGVLLDTLHGLVVDLFDDAGDALDLDLSMPLDAEPLGSAELREVPGVYFELRDRAELAAQGDAPGRESYFRGLCFELLGRSARAVECFSRALRYDREDGELNLLLGRTLNDLGQFDRATSFLERAVRALPEDADASNSLGVAYQSTGSNQDAVRAFERAAALSPDDPTILVNLGRAYVDTDRLDMAREILLRALERSPSLFEARASLAMLSLRTGEREDALEHARLALSSRPDDEAMRELVALLTESEE